MSDFDDAHRREQEMWDRKAQQDWQEIGKRLFEDDLAKKGQVPSSSLPPASSSPPPDNSWRARHPVVASLLPIFGITLGLTLGALAIFALCMLVYFYLPI